MRVSCIDFQHIPNCGQGTEPWGETPREVPAPYNANTQQTRTRFWDGKDHFIRVLVTREERRASKNCRVVIGKRVGVEAMGFAAFAGQKYLNLETFRKSGQGVRTPVWFAADPSIELDRKDAKLYVYTIGVSGKVKRIRNDPRVKVAPCDMRGGLKGDWVPARAEILVGAEAQHGMQLLNRKYAPWKQLLDFFAMFRKRDRTVFVIRAN